MKGISKDIHMNFGLEECAQICLKSVGFRARHTQEAHLRRTIKNRTQVVEESHDTENKNEKEVLKKEYLMILRLVLSSESSAKNKIQAIQSLAGSLLRVLELLTGAKKICKIWIAERGNC